MQLNLKRTDYIVIDDRQGSDEKTGSADGKTDIVSETDFLMHGEEQEIEDIKPLSASELEGIDLKVASYLASSDNALETFLRLTQDFPKHSSYFASKNVSEAFVTEHEERKPRSRRNQEEPHNAETKRAPVPEKTTDLSGTYGSCQDRTMRCEW